MKKLSVRLSQTRNGHRIDAGTIHYRDQGSGKPIVFVHGLLVSGSLWKRVVEHMPEGVRCLAPDWPLGSHTEPMAEGCDLSPEGVAELVSAFLAALDLHDVTLVGNDSGGAICQVVMTKHPDRVGRVVLTTCDAFDVFPPKLFSYLVLLVKMPWLIGVMASLLWWVKPLRQLSTAYGLLTKEPIAQPLLDEWLQPVATNAGVRRDLHSFISGVSPRVTQAAAAEFHQVKAQVLVVWSPEDPSFPMRLAERLVKELPNSELATISNSYIFSAIDQPQELAGHIARFVLGDTPSIEQAHQASASSSAQTRP